MTTKLLALVAEVLSITLGFFLFAALVSQTGLGARLYRPEIPHGTYIGELFWGMACAAALLRLASLTSTAPSALATSIQVLIPAVVAGVAMGVTMLVVGLVVEGIKAVTGSENPILMMVFTAFLVAGAAFLATYLERRQLVAIPKLYICLGACLCGLAFVLYSARVETSKWIVAVCFLTGFSLYLFLRTFKAAALADS